MLASTLHGLQGTPYIYQGEEIGMTNPGYQHIDDYQDVESRNIFAIKQAEGMSEAEILAILAASPDNSRTPMQWSAAPTPASRPALRLKPAANYPGSMPRRRSPTSTRCSGTTGISSPFVRRTPSSPRGLSGAADGHARIWAYARRADDQTLVVVSNFYGEPVAFDLPAELASGGGRLLLGNYPTARPARNPASCALTNPRSG